MVFVLHNLVIKEKGVYKVRRYIIVTYAENTIPKKPFLKKNIKKYAY